MIDKVRSHFHFKIFTLSWSSKRDDLGLATKIHLASVSVSLKYYFKHNLVLLYLLYEYVSNANCDKE